MAILSLFSLILTNIGTNAADRAAVAKTDRNKSGIVNDAL